MQITRLSIGRKMQNVVFVFSSGQNLSMKITEGQLLLNYAKESYSSCIL